MLRTPLSTQLVLAVVAFVVLLSIAAAVAYRVRAAAHDNLDQSFRTELAVLNIMGPLRETLRHFDTLDQGILLRADPAFLADRERLVQDLRSQLAVLTQVVDDPADVELLHRFELRFSDYQSAHERMLRDLGASRLSPAQIEIWLKDHSAIEELLSLLSELKSLNLADLERARIEVQRASLRAYLLILGAGLVLGMLAAALFSARLVRPLHELSTYVKSWQLGSEWRLAEPSTVAELDVLFRTLQTMSSRLNSQFDHERELNEFKTRLVSMVSHEFNNALNVIHGAVALLERPAGRLTPERREELVRMVQAQVRTLSLTVQNLLHLGRWETGRISIRARRTELRSFLEQAVLPFRILADRKELALVLDVPADLPSAAADSDTLMLVVSNLVSNAIKYTPTGGQVTVRARHAAGVPRPIRVEVADTGIGIAEEERSHIATPYFRTNAGQKTAAGFGVGLHLAKQMLEAHDSVLELESRPGAGSTFRFSLAEWREEQPPATKPPASA